MSLVADPVLVYSAARVLDGQLVKARLEDEGIPVMLKGEGEGPYRLGPVDVYVPAEFEIQARLVLEAIDRGDYAVEAGEEPES